MKTNEALPNSGEDVVTKHVEVNWQLRLRKDLLPGEEICEACMGVGLTIDDRPFTLKGTIEFGFPYKLPDSCYNYIIENGLTKAPLPSEHSLGGD